MNTFCSQLLIAAIPSALAFIGSCYLANRKAKAERSLLIKEYGLQKGRYVSEKIFDTEFIIYRELSEKMYITVQSNSLLFPDYIDEGLPQDKSEKNEIRHERLTNAVKDNNKYRDAVARNASFISNNLYEKFEKIVEECSVQIAYYKMIYFQEIAIENQMLRYAQTTKIRGLMTELQADLRKYMVSQGMRIE